MEPVDEDVQETRFDQMEVISDLKNKLSFVGCWPPSDSNLKTRIKGITCVVSLTIFSVSTLVKVFSDFTQFESASFGAVCALAGLNCLSKFVVVLLNEKLFMDVLGHLRNTSFTSHKKEFDVYLRNNMELSSKIQVALRVCGLGLFIVIAGSPFLSSIKGRPLLMPFPLDVKERTLSLYLLALFVQVFGSGIIAYTTPCYDSYIFTLLLLAVGQSQVLQQKIMDIVEKFGKEERDEGVCKDPLGSCIEHHIAIDRFITLMQDAFMWSFLIQITVSLMITCFIGFNLALMPIMSLQFGRTLLFLVAVIIELSMFCVPGNDLILESEKIRDACYISKWNNCEMSIQRSLFLIMERSKRPLTLTAAKLIPLSLPTLLSIMRSSVSYFMFMWQMYKETTK